MLLDDGSELNLGILTSSHDDEAALRALQQLVAGRAVYVADAGKDVNSRIDRYGRLHANAAVTIEGNSVWLQGNLVARGLARVDPLNAQSCGRRDLLRLEEEARAGKRGHWATGVFAILDATDAKTVSTHIGHFAMIEGRPRRRSETRKGVYYNFGKNWRDDVTVFLTHRLAKQDKTNAPGAGKPDFRPGNITRDPPQGRARSETRQIGRKSRTRLRVRGWVEERGGPLIEVRDPDQIEWIE